MTDNGAILKYIEEIQKGKSGIYPYRVTEEVSRRFEISQSAAALYVIEHIRKVLEAYR